MRARRASAGKANQYLDKTVAKLISVSHSRFTVEKDNITAED